MADQPNQKRQAFIRRLYLEHKINQLGNIERLAALELLTKTELHRVALALSERLAQRISQAGALIQKHGR